MEARRWKRRALAAGLCLVAALTARASPWSAAARGAGIGEAESARVSASGRSLNEVLDRTICLPSALRAGRLTSPRGLDLTLGRIVDGAGHDMAWAGEILYRTEAGSLVALDVTDPAVPREIGRTALLPAMFHAVHVSGDLAVVAAGAAGLAVIDVARPATMTVLAEVRTAAPVSAVVQHGGFAYAGTDGGLIAIDLRAPAMPGPVVPVDPAAPMRLLALRDSLLYAYSLDAWQREGSLHVFDVSRLTAPREVARLQHLYRAVDMAFAGDRLYLANGVDYEIDAVDVSDPRAPRHAGSYRLTAGVTPSALVFDRGRLYLGGEEGLAILDLADPLAPVLAGSVIVRDATGDYVPAPVTALAVRGDRLLALAGYAASGPVLGNATHVRAYDVSSAASPRLIADEPSPWSTTRLRVDDRSIYLLDSGVQYRGARLLRYDVTTPGRPVKRAATGPLGFADVAFQHGFGYGVAFWPRDELVVFDVDSWPALTERGRAALPGNADGIAVSGSYLAVLISRPDDGPSAPVVVIDVADPSAPRVVGAVDLPGAKWRDLAFGGTHLYAVGSGHPGLVAIDVADPSSLHLAAMLDDVGGSGLAIDGDRMYVASSARLDVLDLSTPDAPRRTGSAPIGQGEEWTRFSLAVVDRHVLVSGAGLLVFDVSDPRVPWPVNALAAYPFDATDLDWSWSGLGVVDRHAYLVAQGYGSLGLGVVRISQPSATADPDDNVVRRGSDREESAR